MPGLEISKRDLDELIGKKIPVDQLEQSLEFAKTELENVDGDVLKVTVEDSNRPDLWSVEGIARQLKSSLSIKTGLKEYSAKPSGKYIDVNKSLDKIRPYIAACVVKAVKFTDEGIQQLMQQQEKLHGTFGRNRKKVSIGLYNYDMLKFPLSYTVTAPEENAFVPLQMKSKMTPAEILTNHPKGIEYADLLAGLKEYPLFMDADKKVLSMPPIINSNDLGQINENTKNVLIEVTGSNKKAVEHALKIMAITLADRGGEIESIEINYEKDKVVTPLLNTTKHKLKVDNINKRLGTDFRFADVSNLLQLAGFNVIDKKDHIEVEIPTYRNDIMHSVDLIEDIAINFGYNNFKPLPLEISTTGGLTSLERLSDKVRNICIGLGGQEVMTFTLTNKDEVYSKMELPEGEVVEIANPVSQTYSALRNWLVPSALEFLSKNIKKEFPQSIFEVGDVVESDLKTRRKVCFAITHNKANFTEARQVLDRLATTLGIELDVKETDQLSFIPGRVGVINIGGKAIGIIGEIHPQVLLNWGIEMPVVLFEMYLDELF